MHTSQKGLGEIIILLIIGGVLLLGGLAYFGLDSDNQAIPEAGSNPVTIDNNNTNDNSGVPVRLPTTTVTGTGQGANDVAFTLKLENLSAEQTALLRMRGVEGNEIEITNEMVTCAEGRLGAVRVAQIRNGAELTMAEKVQLLACYQ